MRLVAVIVSILVIWGVAAIITSVAGKSWFSLFVLLCVVAWTVVLMIVGIDYWMRQRR